MAKISKKAVEKACQDGCINQSQIAKALRVSRTAMTLYVKRHPEVLQWMEKARVELVDKAENHFQEVMDLEIEGPFGIRKDIMKEKTKISETILKTLGKDRGYVERQETEFSLIGDLKAYVGFSPDEWDKEEKKKNKI